MKAALFSKVGSLDIVDRESRSPGPGEILLRIEACGVCGTDIHIVGGTSHSTPPVVLGHEFSGIVESVGVGVKEFQTGQHVVVDPNISCGKCFFCKRGDVHLCKDLRALGVDLDGGMAELCVVPVSQVYRLPDHFPPDAGAFVEPVSCALHGIDRAGIQSGDTVAILGGGTIGLMMLQLAKHAGAAKTIVVEPHTWKQEIAQGLDATATVDPNEAPKAIHAIAPEGADVVLECSGIPSSAELAMKLARRGGTIELFGVCSKGRTIAVEPYEIFMKELKIVGSFVNPHTFDRAITALATGVVRVDAFRIGRYPIDGVIDAFNALRSGETMKSMIIPGS